METGPVIAAENEASGKFWGNDYGDIKETILEYRRNDFLTGIQAHMPLSNIVPGIISRRGNNFDQREHNLVTDEGALMRDQTKPMSLNDQRRFLMLGTDGYKSQWAYSQLPQFNPMNPGSGGDLLNQTNQGGAPQDQSGRSLLNTLFQGDQISNNIKDNLKTGFAGLGVDIANNLAGLIEDNIGPRRAQQL